MKVIVAGENPFVAEVGKLCKRHGHRTTMILVEDFVSALAERVYPGGFG